MCEKSPGVVALHTTTLSPVCHVCSIIPHSSTQFLSKQLNPIFSTAVFITDITLHCDDCSVVDLYLPLSLTAVLISLKKKKKINTGRGGRIKAKNQLPKQSSFLAQAEINMLGPNGAEMSCTII